MKHVESTNHVALSKKMGQIREIIKDMTKSCGT
jgi:hypothetical protein